MLLVVNEQKVTISIWNTWIYKRIGVFNQLSIGLAELNTGVTKPLHIAEPTALHILSGRGRAVLGGKQFHLDAGASLNITPGQEVGIECHSPMTLLVARCVPPDTPLIQTFTIPMLRQMPFALFSSNQGIRPIYIESGCGTVRSASGLHRIQSGDTIHCDESEEAVLEAETDLTFITVSLRTFKVNAEALLAI